MTFMESWNEARRREGHSESEIIKGAGMANFMVPNNVTNRELSELLLPGVTEEQFIEHQRALVRFLDALSDEEFAALRSEAERDMVQTLRREN